MKVSEIIRVPEIEKEFPKPNNYEEIKNDIATRGIQESIVINTAKQLICGYTRLAIAEGLDIEEMPHRTVDIIKPDTILESSCLTLSRNSEVNMNYRQIAEKYFNKTLQPDEVVHHIDGNQSNNDPENLVIMKASQHSRIHASLLNSLQDWRDEKHKSEGCLCNYCLYINSYEDPSTKELWHDFDFAVSMIDMVLNRPLTSGALKTRDWQHFTQTVYEELKRRNQEENHEVIKD